jgi:hypothetical protein
MFISFVFISTFFTQAQTSVSGCVQDSTKKALPNANVSFFQNESLVANIQTDKKGCFTLRLDTGKYTVNVLHLGYAEYKEEVQLSSENLRLPVIVLPIAETELSELVVVGAPKMYEAKLNKDIYRIPDNIKKSSSNIFVVLSSLPFLSVNEFDKTIRLTGASNSSVLVNNIRRNREYLQLIQPENIERIEVSHAPGARYSVKGVDGIINIITKSPTSGYNGYLDDETSLSALYTRAEGGFNYAAEKTIISVNGSESWYHDKKRDYSLVRDANGVHTDKRNNNRYDGKYHIPKLSANLDYTLSSKSFITLNANYSDFPLKAEIPYAVRQSFSDGQILNQFDALQRTNSSDRNYNVNVYFQTKFSEKKTMNVDMDYSLSKTKNKDDYTEFNEAGLLYENHQLNRNNQKSANIQINFHQEASKIEWEEGARFQLQDNQFHNETNAVNTDRQQQRIQGYAYVNALGSFGERYAYQIENIFDVLKMSDQKATARVYAGFTPRVMFRYFIDENQSFMFRYSLTHNYPDFSILNPVPVYVDSSRFITGNPDLKPFFRNSFRLTYQITRPHFKKLFVRMAVLYQTINNHITQKEDLESNGAYHISYLNAAHRSNLQFQFTGSFDIIKGWKIIWDGWVRHVTFKDDYQLQFNKKYWEYSLSWRSQVQYKNFYFYYQHDPTFRTPALTGYWQSETYTSISARYKLSRQWEFGVRFRDFVPKMYQTETYTDNYSEIYTNTMTQRHCEFTVSAQYYFQKGIQKQNKQKQTKQYGNSVGRGDVKVY